MLLLLLLLLPGAASAISTRLACPSELLVLSVGRSSSSKLRCSGIRARTEILGLGVSLGSGGGVSSSGILERVGDDEGEWEEEEDKCKAEMEGIAVDTRLSAGCFSSSAAVV